MRNLILASTSPYRRELLKQLGIPFTVATPLYTEKLDHVCVSAYIRTTSTKL